MSLKDKTCNDCKHSYRLYTEYPCCECSYAKDRRVSYFEHRHTAFDEYVKGKVWDSSECYALSGDMYREILKCTFEAGEKHGKTLKWQEIKPFITRIHTKISEFGNGPGQYPEIKYAIISILNEIKALKEET